MSLSEVITYNDRDDDNDGDSEFMPERQTYVGPPGRAPRTPYQEPKFPKKSCQTLSHAENI